MNENNQCTLNRYFSTNPLSCNWFNVVDPRTIANLPTIQIDISQAPLSDRRAIKVAFKAFGVVKNEADGLLVTFPAASAGKMLYQSGTDIRAIVSSFKTLFEKSIRAWDEKEVPMSGHKFHFNVSAYSNYISKFLLNNIEYFVRFTIRKIGKDSSVHASTISEVAIYRKTEGIPADSHLENPEDGHRMPFIDNKIAFFLAACQPPHSSIQTFKHSNIHALLSRLHARLGDFWWYSLLLFVAMRAADVLNMFVGLWLVPKYVAPSELGAVQPLISFANLLAVPAIVFASTFRQELTSLAINNEFGKMKTLMRTVFIISGVFFAVAIVASKLLFPILQERIRIAEGSLAILVLISSFSAAIAPTYSNAIQTLKKFKAQCIINLLGAPVRFIAMIITMPLRAISGYFVGQSAPSFFSIFASIYALRNELHIRPQPYWNRTNLFKFGRIFFIFLICSIAGYFSGLVESTIIRQRLPEADSAAYYIITRFSDISGFLATTLCFTLFPFAAEVASKGKSTLAIYLKTSSAVILTNIVLSVLFLLAGQQILLLLPNGELYQQYYWAIPMMIITMTFWWIASLYTTTETAAGRFGYMFWWIPINVIYTGILLFVNGIEYFKSVLPSDLYALISTNRIDNLKTMIFVLLSWNIFKVICCIIAIASRRRNT